MKMCRHHSIVILVLLNMLAGCSEDHDFFTSVTFTMLLQDGLVTASIEVQPPSNILPLEFLPGVG